MFWETRAGFFIISLYLVNCESNPITSTDTADIKNIKENFKLYQNNLLNENLLPFLKQCYSPNCCVENDDLLCPSYFELVRLLNVANVTINATNQELIKEVEKFSSDFAGDIDVFCKKIPKYIPENSFFKSQKKQDMIHKAINNPNTCKLLCTNLELDKAGPSYTIKPVCNFILWMSATAFHSGTINKTQELHMNNSSGNVNIAGHSNVKINSSFDKAQNADKNTTKQISNSTPSIVKTEPLVTSSISKINNNSVKNLDETTKIEKSQTQNSKVVKEQQQDKQKSPNHQDKPLEQPKQLPNQQQSQQVQEQQHQQQDPDINDLDGSSEFKNKPDLNAYSEDDEEEDDGTTNDIFKTNFNFKDAKIENIKENFDQSIYEKNENANTIISTDPFYEESGSNFFIYFLIAMFICMIAYVLYHNKSKILALAIEGRRSQKGKTRRKHLAGYRKLDTNLEEAITSTSSGQATQIIY